MTSLGDVATVTPEKPCVRRRSVRVQKIMSGMPEKGGHLTFGHKFALAVGAGPITLPLITTTVYIQMFLLDVARVLPMYATTIIVVARILDAVSDPTVGAIVNKTQEKGGSLRKWMLFSLPISILSFFFLWWVPPFLTDQVMVFIYYMIVYTVLQMAFTMYSIPFCSLVMYQSTDESERDAATSFRLVGEAVFAVLSLFVVRFSELITDSGSLENSNCLLTNSLVGPETVGRYRQTFMMQGAVGSLIILISGLYCFFGSMENTDIHIDAKIGMLRSFKNCMTFKPYLLLAFAYLAGYVAVNITQGCLLLYFKYVIDKESIFTVAMLALVISGALSIPLWKLLIGKYGKRKVSFCAVAITVPAFSMLSVITKDITTPYLIAFAVITGPGCACGFYIPWVLLPDVIDAYTVEFNQRNESIFYGFFVFLSKLAAGCVTGGTMITLKVLDYDATKCDQNESVNMALRVICAACPTFLLLLFGIVMYFFPLNEAKMEENRKYLQRTFFSHTVNVNKDEQNATSTNAVVPCVNNSSFSNTRVRTLSSDFDAQREGSGSIVSSLNRPQDSGGGHPNGARHSSQGSSPVPIQFTSDLQFEYQKSPEGRDSARSLSQVPENESTVEMSNDVNDSMKNTTAVGVLNGKGKTNHVSYEDERKIGRSRSSCSSKSDDKTSPKASRRSPEPGSSKVGPTKPMQSNNTQVVNNTNQFAASNYKFPPARRKDYELLTVRHSLPTIIVAPGDQKSKFHSSMKSHAGSHARKMSYCSNSNTQNSSQTRSAKHKRVMSDFASRA